MFKAGEKLHGWALVDEWDNLLTIETRPIYHWAPAQVPAAIMIYATLAEADQKIGQNIGRFGSEEMRQVWRREADLRRKSPM